jgi:diguanylate cyclase (GGDEF)-like protein
MIGSVNASKNRLSGIEVGKCGVHYRLALPVFNTQGRHLGAFEFGISIDYLFDLFSREYGFTPLLLLKKKSFELIEEKSRGLNYTLFGQEHYLIVPSKDPIFDLLDTEVLDEKYTLLSNAGRDDLVFGVTDLRNSIEEDLGKILFVKNLNFYTDKIAFVERVTFGLAALILLFSFFLLRKTFTSYIVMMDRYKSVLEIKNRSLLRLAHTDHLTKISNRKSIEKLLKEELKRANRYQRPLSLIMLDVDDFKKINDTFGHSGGDKVLRQLSRIISSAIRDTDHFGRWGGEEFIIVTTETPLENALHLCEKIRTLLSTAKFEGDQKVSCSIGVAPYRHGDDYDRLLSNADLAMYEAKNSGKDRVVSYGTIQDIN